MTTPVHQLDVAQKREQLDGAIHLRHEPRIWEILNSDHGFLHKPPDQFSTWLGRAISRGCSLSILEKLVEAGCDPNTGARSPDNTRPLEVAVGDDRPDAIVCLLEAGADPNLGRPLVRAVNPGIPPESQLRMLALLVDGGADVNRTYDLYGDETKRFTVLDWATIYGTAREVIRFLQDRGAVHLAELG